MRVRCFGLSENRWDLTAIDASMPTGNSIVWFDTGKSLCETIAEDGRPTVVILHKGSGYDIYQLCQELTSSYSYVSVILVVPSQQLELKRAMRMGAADTLSSPFSRDEIKQALQVADQRLSL
ncbi:MAG TPA: hypothetical protein VJ824_13870, partial [Bacillota bacterium]|nr:hypothetical protein [Bacillota bacterium]